VRLLVTAACFLIGSIILYFIPGISVDAYALGCLAFFAIPFTIGLLQSVSYLWALTRKQE
jgi:hypothetical protein